MKLLKRILRSYLIYSALILIVSVPLFYFIIRSFCMQDVDEALQNRKSEVAIQIQAQPEMLHTLPWKDFTKNTIIYPPVSNAKPDEIISMDEHNPISDELEPYRELQSYIHVEDKTYPVTLRISLIDIEDLIQGTVLSATLLLILILGGLLLINRRQSKEVWQPFYQILNQLKTFNIDHKPDLRFTRTDIFEFKELQQAILSLSDRAYKAYLQQKEFTGNAAHEMQTPLASIQAKLELLAQDEALSEKQSKHLQAMEETVIRMARLNQALLLLAKIDNQQFLEKETLQVVPLIQKIIAQSQYKTIEKSLTIETSYEDFELNANATLMGILLSNLVQNALRYAPFSDKIRINVTPCFVEIRNSGEPLSFSKDKLFERFQKGNTMAASDGNGLGLAIVRKICNICHYTIHYNYQGNQHCFTLNFRPDRAL